MAQDKTGTGGGDPAWSDVDVGFHKTGAEGSKPPQTVDPGAEGGSGGGWQPEETPAGGSAGGSPSSEQSD